MKILMTSSFYPPYHVGGADTLVKYFAEKLVEEGHEVHVLFSLDAFRFKRAFERKPEDYKGVIVHALESPLGKAEPVLNYAVNTQAHTQRAFESLVREHDFDVVHHHNISLLGYRVLHKTAPYRSIYTAHDFWLVCPKFDLYKFGTICEKRTCGTCVWAHGKPYPLYQLGADWKRTINEDIDQFIAPSHYMKGRIQREIDRQVEVIWNFAPRPPANIAKPKEDDYFLFVGQLERHKGILPLIEAFAGRTEKLLIFGRGALESKIKERLLKDDVKNIDYKGWASTPGQVLSYMKHANALVLPSLWAENNPIVAIEALSVGTPIIGTRNGGIPEISALCGKDNLTFDGHDFSQLRGILAGFRRKDYSSARLKGIFEREFSWRAHKRKLKEAGYFG